MVGKENNTGHRLEGGLMVKKGIGSVRVLEAEIKM